MSHHLTLLAALTLLASLMGPSHAAYAGLVQIDFENPPFLPGTQYGSLAGDVPGDQVFSIDSIDVTVENFTIGAFTGFHVADITMVGTPAQIPTQSLGINNISMQFDLTGLSVPIGRATFEYWDFGGDINFQINNTGVQEHNLLSLVVAPPGFAVNVTETVVASPPHRFGTVEVIAAAGHSIDRLTVGGQELFIDNVHAIPEPSSALFLLLLGASGSARAYWPRRRTAA